MKTRSLRLWALAVVSGASLACMGCAKSEVHADEVPVYTKNPALAVDDQPKDKDADEPEAPSDTKPADTNAAPAATVVQTPVTPAHLQVSPGLAEVIKLAQAGVNEEIILTYVTNSSNIYNVGSEEIVYLNDLGVSSTVIRELIRKDGSPEMLERKRALTAASPLPPGVALQSPATNIFYNSPLPQQATDVGADSSAATAPPTETVAATEPVQAPQAVVAQSPESTYFYDSLAPYGNWVQVENYGLCWQPTVAIVNRSWRPYADHGRWYWSDAGWYWYSDYSWGWAPFHYGRWSSSPRVGWFWVPDSVWGPSWVTWRYNSSYCGWAPLPPYSHYVSGVGLVYRNSAVSIGFGFNFGAYDYNYVSWNHFHGHSPHRHFAHHSHRSSIFRDSTPVNKFGFANNNTIVNEGFGLERAAQRSGTQIAKLPIRTASLPANRTVRPERLVSEGSTLAVVRPELPRRQNVSSSDNSGAGQGRTIMPSARRIGNVDRSSAGSAVVPTPNTAGQGNERQANRSGLGNAARVQRSTDSIAAPGNPGAGNQVSTPTGNDTARRQSTPIERPRPVNPDARTRVARAPFQPVPRPAVPVNPAQPGNAPVANAPAANRQEATPPPSNVQRRQNIQNRPQQPNVVRPQSGVERPAVINRPQVPNAAPSRNFQPFSAPVRREAPIQRPQVQAPIQQRPSVQQSAPAMRSAPAPQQQQPQQQRSSGGNSRPQQRPSRSGREG